MDKFITPGIRIGIRALEAQIDEKNKNVEAQQNVTGSYKKTVYCGRKVNLYIECVKYFHITCQMVP